MGDFVNYKAEEAFGIITITREKALNALNSDVLKQLNEVLDNVDFSSVRVLILTGAGDKSFVAGADIAQMKDLSKKEGEEFGRLGNDVFLKLENLPIPTIAAVNGFCLGGGCELSMACDIRIASENAVFGQPETGLGITPGFGGTQRLPRIIGTGRAKELIYTCNKIDACEAYRLGLVSAVYPLENLMEEAKKMARKIASNAPIAVRNSKRAINEGMQVDIASAVRIESQCFGDCFGTEDQQNGMTAFLEKRKHDPYVNR